MAGDTSYLVGASTANQRIEYWRGFLRGQCVQFWFNKFHGLKEEVFYDGDVLDKNPY